MSIQIDSCQLCGFKGNLQKHHLVPQRVCRNKYKSIKDDPNNHIYICDMCHRTIHAYFSENELRDDLCSLDSLIANDRFASYLKWRKKHMGYNSNSTKMSNRRK